MASSAAMVSANESVRQKAGYGDWLHGAQNSCPQEDAKRVCGSMLSYLLPARLGMHHASKQRPRPARDGPMVQFSKLNRVLPAADACMYLNAKPILVLCARWIRGSNQWTTTTTNGWASYPTQPSLQMYATMKVHFVSLWQRFVHAGIKDSAAIDA